MFFFPYPIKQHDCTPQPIDTPAVEMKHFALIDRAGYSRRKYTYKQTECPVCKKRYKYGDPAVEDLGEISYTEAIALTEKVMK